MAACSFSVFCGMSSFTEKWIPSVIISHRYKAQDTPARRTFEQALTGAFMSAVIKDLRPSALPFVASLIRHYTMVAVAQQCGERMNLSLSALSLCFCPTHLLDLTVSPPFSSFLSFGWKLCSSLSLSFGISFSHSFLLLYAPHGCCVGLPHPQVRSCCSATCWAASQTQLCSTVKRMV